MRWSPNLQVLGTMVDVNAAAAQEAAVPGRRVGEHALDPFDIRHAPAPRRQLGPARHGWWCSWRCRRLAVPARRQGRHEPRRRALSIFKDDTRWRKIKWWPLIGTRLIDQASSTAMVGHEWDGIEELNNPAAALVVVDASMLSILFALGYVVVYPAIPLVHPARRQGHAGAGPAAAMLAGEMKWPRSRSATRRCADGRTGD